MLTVSAGLGNHWMTGPVRGVCVSGSKLVTVECILALLGQTLRARRAMRARSAHQLLVVSASVFPMFSHMHSTCSMMCVAAPQEHG